MLPITTMVSLHETLAEATSWAHKPKVIKINHGPMFVTNLGTRTPCFVTGPQTSGQFIEGSIGRPYYIAITLHNYQSSGVHMYQVFAKVFSEYKGL